MKALKFKFLIITFLTVIFTSTNLFADELKKEIKEYNKEFAVIKGNTLEVKNYFGDVDVQNWNKDEISIYVKVTAEHKDAEKAKEMLELIDIEFSDKGNIKSAETILKDKIKRIKSRGNGKKFSIDYTIKMPSYLNADLSNKFGDMFIDQIDGKADITVKFGTLKLNKLTRGNEKPLNSINLAYAETEAEIKEVNWLNLHSRYSEAGIAKAQALVIDSKYSEISVDNANSIVSDAAYDEYDVDEVTNFVTEGAYSEIEIGKLIKKAEVIIKYGEFSVDYVAKDFNLIDVSAKYAEVELNIDEEAGYTIHGVAKYGDISVPSGAKISKISENMTKTVKGTIGSGKGKVKLKVGYGSIDVE